MPDQKEKLPDIVNCQKHTVSLHGEKIYITVGFRHEGDDDCDRRCDSARPQPETGAPLEIFASCPPSWHYNKERMSLFETCNRLASLALRLGCEAEEVARQAEKGSAEGEYPYMMAKVLRKCVSGEVKQLGER